MEQALPRLADRAVAGRAVAIESPKHDIPT